MSSLGVANILAQQESINFIWQTLKVQNVHINYYLFVQKERKNNASQLLYHVNCWILIYCKLHKSSPFLILFREANFNGFELTFMLPRYCTYVDCYSYLLTSLQTSFLLRFYVWRVSHQLSDNKISFFQESIKQCT